MRNKKKGLLFLWILIRLTQNAIADTGTLTLEVAMKETEVKSPELQISRSVAEQSEWGKTEAFAGFLPKLSIDAIHLFDVRYQTLDLNFFGAQTSFPFITPTTLYSLNFSWSIFNGFQDVDRFSSAKLKSEAAHRDYDWSHFKIMQDVRFEFYQALAAQLLESVAEENVKNLERHLSQVKDLLKAGEAIEVDLLRVQVQLNNAHTQQLNAHDSVIIARQQLAQTLGNTTESRNLEGTLPIPEENIAVQIEQLSRTHEGEFAHRADIEAVRLQAEASEKAENAAAHYWIPTLSVIGDYQFYNNINSDIANSQSFRAAYQYGLELTWNIFDGFLSYAREKEAAATSLQAVKTEAVARLQAATDVEINQNNYRLNLSQFVTSTENLERSKRSVELALVGLRSGTETNTDLLDAELDLFNARGSVIQSQINAVDAEIKFENSIGRNL